MPEHLGNILVAMAAASLNGVTVAMLLHLWFSGSIFARPRAFVETLRDLPDPADGSPPPAVRVARLAGELLTCPLCLGFHLNWVGMAGLAVTCRRSTESIDLLILFWLVFLSEVVSVLVYRKLDSPDDPVRPR